MRIVGGALAGRRLKALNVTGIRPTSDRVREALGSVLHARGALHERRVLDLFAGSGALGLEALSRGAHSLLAVDKNRAALRYVSDAARSLDLDARVATLALDLLAEPRRVLAALEPRGPFGLVFIDPPYAEVPQLGALLDAAASAALLAPDAVVVVEHATRTLLAEVAGLPCVARYRYGDTSVALLQPIA